MNPEVNSLVKVFFYNNVELTGTVELWSDETIILKSKTDNSYIIIKDPTDIFVYKVFVEDVDQQDYMNVDNYEIPLKKHTKTLVPPNPNLEFEVSGIDEDDEILTPEQLVDLKAREAVRLKKFNIDLDKQKIFNTLNQQVPARNNTNYDNQSNIFSKRSPK